MTDLSDLSDYDIKWLEDKIRKGTDLKEAYGQLLVHKQEHEIKQGVIAALHDPEVQDEIQKVVSEINRRMQD